MEFKDFPYTIAIQEEITRSDGTKYSSYQAIVSFRNESLALKELDRLHKAYSGHTFILINLLLWKIKNERDGKTYWETNGFDYKEYE